MTSRLATGSIDTHNGVVPGHVTRIDPSVLNGTRTVDVHSMGRFLAGAVQQLSVDGTIDLERLKDVLYVGRPALGNENSTLSLFKVDPDGKGRRTRARSKWAARRSTIFRCSKGSRKATP